MDKYAYKSAGVHRDETPPTMQEENWSWGSAYDETDERVLGALRRWLQGMEEALSRNS